MSKHGITCDPACRCAQNIQSGRGGARAPIPPTHVLVTRLEVERLARLIVQTDGLDWDTLSDELREHPLRLARAIHSAVLSWP